MGGCGWTKVRLGCKVSDAHFKAAAGGSSATGWAVKLDGESEDDGSGIGEEKVELFDGLVVCSHDPSLAARE